MAIRDQIMLLVVVLFGMATIFTLHFYSSDLETKRTLNEQRNSLQQQIDQLRNEQSHQAQQIAELAKIAKADLQSSISTNSTSKKTDSLPTLYSSFNDDQEVAISRPVHIYTHGGTTWLVEGWPVPNCPIECYFRRTPPIGDDADAVFYSGYDSNSARGDAKHLKIFFASESDALYEFHRDQYTAGFDITVSYHLDTDDIIMDQKKAGRKWIHLPISYAPYLVENFYDPVQPKQTEHLASIFMSNCANSNSGRNNILQELMDTIGVASFGRCLHNKEPEDLGCHLQHYEQKLCAISKYKFYLAFENSIDPSYVTEKYWQALKAGTVPVYLGAPNIDEFDPMYGLGGKSVIKISDFESTADLAKYLQYLDKNETAYNEYLKWKEIPPTPRFKSLVSKSLDFSWSACRVCKAVAVALKEKGLA